MCGGAFKRELTAWGDIVTADHLDSHSRDMLGLHGQPHAFTIMDLWSRLKTIYPVQDKTVETTAMCIRDYAGDVPIKRFYSDVAGNIEMACKKEQILWESSYVTDGCIHNIYAC